MRPGARGGTNRNGVPARSATRSSSIAASLVRPGSSMSIVSDTNPDYGGQSGDNPVPGVTDSFAAAVPAREATRSRARLRSRGGGKDDDSVYACEDCSDRRLGGVAPVAVTIVQAAIVAAVVFGLLPWPVGLGLWILMLVAFMAFSRIRSGRLRASLQLGEWLDVEEPRGFPGDRAYGLFLVGAMLALLIALVVLTIAEALGE
jgi:hypothetical protein